MMNALDLSLAMIGSLELIVVLVTSVLVGAGVAALIVVLFQLSRRQRQPSRRPSEPGTTVKLAACPRCGIPLPADAPQGLCPRCVMQVGLGTQDACDPAFKDASGKANPPDPSELARHFPQLEIIELLGQGGMGAVYKARQKDLDRFVALKVLPGGAGGDPAFAERFSREARALAKLSHPNIVGVHDFGQVGQASGLSSSRSTQPSNPAAGELDGETGKMPVLLYYFIMEFIDGPNLRQLMQSQRLLPREAMTIVPKICEALQFAHDEGVVHRDIKPENILLDRKGRVKIADFGIAKIVGKTRDTTITGAKDVIGTPHYMAPEQVEKPQHVDHRADIYSLGVVFYEMLTGELPLGKFEVPSRKVQVDVRLDEVVLHTLEKEPDRRYQHASEVRTDVETIAAGTSKSKPAADISPSADATSTPGGKRINHDSNAVTAARWTARILGTLLLLFYGTFIIAEGLPPIAAQSAGVQLNFMALGLMLGGFAVGWKREGTAALLIASGWTLWHISEGRIELNLFQTPLPVAALYGYCWWELRGRRTGLFAATVVTLAVALGIGRLVLPVNVFVHGAVTDATTGTAITNGSLAIVQKGSIDQDPSELPNARTGTEGRFRLHLGWYAGRQQVTIAAPGYATLTTNLGPRELGQRSVQRDFQLQAVGAIAASVGATNPIPTITMQNVPLRDVIQYFANQLRLNVLFDAQLEFDRSGPNDQSVLQTEVNVKWENVTIQTALNTLLDTHGLTLNTDRESGITRVSKEPSELVVAGALEPPPVVIRTVPESGATNVDPALAELRVTFSNPMQDGNWSWVKLDDETSPEMTGEPLFSEDRRTCILPVNLEPGRTYAIWINVDALQNFQDQEGTPAVPYLLVFETTEEAPNVVTVSSDADAQFTSVQEAIDTVADGGTVMIGAGRYDETLKITRGVKLVGAGWGRTVIGRTNDWSPPSAEQMQEMERKFRAATSDAERSRLRREFAHELQPPVVSIHETSDVFLEGLKLTAPGVAPAGKLLSGAVIEVRNAALEMKACAVLGSPGSGIVLTDGTRADIRNTLIAAVWNRGVAIDSDSRVVIRDCDIRNCHYAGVTIKGGAEAAIERCRISGAAWHGIRYDHVSPRIEGNLIFGNARSGIYASGRTAGQVRQNVFFDNEMNGISCWSDNQDVIEGNTFANNQREALSILGASAPTVRSNIFSGHPVALYQGRIGSQPDSASLGQPLVLDNVFWSNATNWVRTTRKDADGVWQSEAVELAEATRSRIVDPQFTDAGRDNFQLMSDSAARRDGIGAADPIPFASPWPIQLEEQAIIPDGDTRDSRQWKRPDQ